MTRRARPPGVEEGKEEANFPGSSGAPISDEALPGQPSLFGDAPITPIERDDRGQMRSWDSILSIDGTPSPAYLGSLTLGAVLLIVAALLNIFPWAASAIGIVGLLATMFRGGYWLTLACSAGVIVVAVVSLWPSEPTLADAAPSEGLTSQSRVAAAEIPEGSLGLTLGELSDRWNALDQPPQIDRGFSRSSEPGPLDGFVLRFDQGASLAGAYDPDNDYVYALAASSRLDHESATTMYLHLCFMLHPYSQECIDGYWDEGLDGGVPGDYLGTRHSREWQIGAQTWRLAIVGNVQEIKVLGEPPT